MKTLYLVVVLVAIVTAQEYKLPSSNRYCRRKFSPAVVSSSGYSVSIRTDINCQSGPSKYVRSNVIIHDFTSSPLPTFRLRAWRNATDEAAGNPFFFASRFLIDHIYEYNETNGIPGYQYGSDQLINSYNLWDTYKINKWSALSINSIPVTSTVTVQDITTSISKNDVAAMSFGIKLTTDEVIDTSNNITKIILDTISFKTLLSLNDITYSSSDPNVRLSIGGVLITKGGLYNITTLEQSSPDGERPDENTVHQSCAGVYNGYNTTTYGFFSFQRMVAATDQNGNYKVANLIASDYMVLPFNNITLLADEEGFTIRRVFLSLDAKVSSFTWDPSVGVLETPENPSVGGANFVTNAPTPLSGEAPSITKSFILLIIIVLLQVLLL